MGITGRILPPNTDFEQCACLIHVIPRDLTYDRHTHIYIYIPREISIEHPSVGLASLAQLYGCTVQVCFCFLQPCSQGCHKVATSLSTLPQPCSTVIIPLQPAHYNPVTTMSCFSQACHNLVTSLSQPCHNIEIFSPPHAAVITLQACDKVTHVHLIIFILTKTQRESIEVHST